MVSALDGKDGRQKKKLAQPEPVQPNLKHMESFRDEGGGYQIHYPANWKVDDRSAANQMIRANIGQGDRVGFQIRLYDDVQKEFDAFVDWYAKQFKKDMQSHWGGEMSVVGQEHGLIGKHSGSRLSYIINRRDGEKWFFKHYLWQQGQRAIVLQCGTPVALRSENEPVLDRIAETFEFVE